MFEKIVLYFFVITLNSATKFSEGSDLNKRNKLLKIDNNITTEAANMWQPIIPTHNLLLTPTLRNSNNTPLQKSHLRNNFSSNAIENDFKSKKQQAYDSYLAQNDQHHRRNYNKQDKKRLFSSATLTTQPHLSPATQSMEPVKLKSQSYPFNIKNTQRSNGSETYQYASQPQHLSTLDNKITIPYTQIQKTKDIFHQERKHPKPPRFRHRFPDAKYSILAKISNLKPLTDTEGHKEEFSKTTSSSTTHWHYLPQAKHIATLQTDNSTTSNKTINEKENNTQNNLSTTLNSFKTERNSIDNEIPNVREHQHLNHQLTSLSHSDVKVFKADAEEAVKKTKFATVDGRMFFRKLLNYFEGLYEHSKNERIGVISSSDQNKEHEYKISINDDDINDDIDLKALSSSARQLVRGVSKTLSAVIAAALQPFDMKELFIYLTSTGITSLSSFLPGTNATQNEIQKTPYPPTAISEIQTTAQRRNLSFESKNTASKTTTSKTPTYAGLISPKSKSSTSLTSGRKIKKVKKKLQQLLLPLLLAYKLKFMALIPLLAGGLIMLVGSTGLAGFFFALFAAVMTLKTDHGSAILVKKY